jgi:hypothetical protein
MKHLYPSIFFILVSCSITPNHNEQEYQPWLTYEDYPSFYISSFELEESYKIWDNAPHNAFTNIVKYGDYYYVVFREASSHNSFDGIIRLIKSKDLKVWESASIFSLQNKDLRDPKIHVDPINQLSVKATSRYSINGSGNGTHISLLWKSSDGSNWSLPIQISSKGKWLWNYKWNKSLNRSFGFSYNTEGPRSITLVSSGTDYIFNILSPDVFTVGNPGESDITFINDSLAVALTRRDENHNSLIGFSHYPFSQWNWKEINDKISSPNIIVLPDNRILAGIRYLQPERRTALVLIDVLNKNLVEVLSLPSGYDNGYPGIILEENKLIISYYSAHQGKTAIYIAKVSF